ncbi:G-type lectin S-receptor-like serine/threonine-protein kinase At5g24080 [Euphorbia peplus]|nr:G-type lectin S-receptor-like serine/threonine-protein kinase At5g24080 [Euphorbia peplus]
MDHTYHFVNILFMIISIIISFSPHLTSSLSILKHGSSLSVQNREDTLVSPNEVFSAGFYPLGTNAYCFAVWYSKPSCTRSNCTAIWMANRDFPVNGRSSKISLQENGNLVLTDAGKSIAWSTDSVSHFSTQLILSDLGNLVLQNTENVVLWQSFDSPTDTLLPLQEFNKDMKLVSSRSRTNVSSGLYKLFFNSDNLLRLLYEDEKVSSMYWPDPWLVSWATTRFSYNSTRVAFLNPEGKFTSSDNLTFLAADYGSILQRRLTLDFDGNLRLYSRKENSLTWLVSWVALAKQCMIHGACGPNSQCIHDPVTNGRKCICLPGYKIKDTTDWSYGCDPEFNLACTNESHDADQQVHFIKLSHTEFYGFDYGVYTGYTAKQCEELCLSLCNCKGFQYRYIDGQYWNVFTLMNHIKETRLTAVCYPKVSLLNGYRAPDYDGEFYVKVAKTSPISDDSGFGLNCSAEVVLSPVNRAYPKSHQNEKLNLIVWFAIVLGAIEIIAILIVFSLLRSFHHSSNEPAYGYHHVGITGLKRFTYSELKAATKNFSVEIGRGASGTVYKGKLSDDRMAAVKRLNTSNQGEAEFLAEVSTIGKLHHMNLIEMWGYCVEKHHRLLVYQYMKHGSLAEKLSCQKLDWQRRFEIAIGTARGLAYLHEECLEWILHCDVKPENILLDCYYQPKVSDFGLSKLLNRGDDMGNMSTLSRMRGTRGYMAPEWVSNLPITSKVDVYSYGIVVLEMVTGKKYSSGSGNVGAEQEERGLVEWIREMIKGGESWIEEIADPMFEGEYDRDEMDILVSLALKCVEEDKDSRPTMRQVTESLMHHQNSL